MLIYNMTQPLKHETIWFDKYKYDDAERQFEELKAKTSNDSCDQDSPPDEGHNKNVLNEEQERPPVIQSLADEIALARRRIQNTLQRGDNPEVPCICEDAGYRRLADRLQVLEDDNLLVKKMVADVESHFKLFTSRLNAMEAKYGSKAVSAAVSECVSNGQRLPDDDDDDNMELFCSDGEDEATSKLHKERLEAYENKKSKKSPVVAKSSVVLDIKPWDDETNMEEMEKGVREIQSDGLKWGASKLVPLAYGIQKLQIVVIVEDNKISVDWLQETIQEIDLVQSVDIAAFNKL